MKPVLLTLFACSIVVAIEAQSPPQVPPRDAPRLVAAGSAVISGTVVTDDEARAPLRRATITLSRMGIEDMRVTATDDEGRFRLVALPAGSYTLGVSKGAYVSMSYGAAKAGMPGRSIVLAEGQQFAAAPIALTRGAVIGGRLLDRSGVPVDGIRVSAAQVITLGSRRLRRGTTGASAVAVTNAHGEFRIYGLLPGEYLVYVNPPPDSQTDTSNAEVAWARQPAGPSPPRPRPFGYAPTIFPGTTDEAAAVPVAVARGEERLGVDIPLQYVPMSRVSGVVSGPDGQPVSAVVLRIQKQSSQLLTAPSLTIQTGSNGAFTFPDGVIPGEWLILVRGPSVRGASGGGYPLWGLAEVRAAGNDVPDVAIQLQPGSAASGRIDVRAPAAATPVDLARVQVRLAPANPQTTTFGGSPSATAGADGSFRIDGVVPGLWKVALDVGGSTSALGPWFVRSAMLDGRDLLDVPFEVRPGVGVSGIVVTLADTRTELSGALIDAAGQPASQVYVSVFSTDKTNWTPGSRRVASVRATDAGLYWIAGLPAGEYYLCALTELDSTLQFEPEYLEQLVPSAIKITLADGEKKTQDLRVGG